MEATHPGGYEGRKDKDMRYNRNSFYDGKQKYKIVEGTISDYRVIAEGLTSQKAVREKYKELREQGIETKHFLTISYK